METARECAINLYESFLRNPDKRDMLVDGIEAFLTRRDVEARRAAMAECADYLKGLGMVVAAERIEAHARRGGAEKEGRTG